MQARWGWDREASPHPGGGVRPGRFPWRGNLCCGQGSGQRPLRLLCPPPARPMGGGGFLVSPPGQPGRSPGGRAREWGPPGLCSP